MLGLLAGLLVFLAGAFCWRRGWLGGGDVKLLAATAVLVPPSLVVNLLLDVALAGGVSGDDLSRDGSIGCAAITLRRAQPGCSGASAAQSSIGSAAGVRCLTPRP